MSKTRIPFSDSGLLALNSCRTADSTHREYSFRFSSTPAYTSSTVGAGIAGQGRTLIVGRFFSVRHFSAMLPLLLEICFPCLLCVKPGSALIDGLFFDRYPPFPQ